MSKHGRRQQVYDHRLRELVRRTGDPRIAADCGVPRTTAAGWLHMEPVEAVTLDVLKVGEAELRAEVMKLRRRVRLLQGVVGVLVATARACGVRTDGMQRLEDSDQELLVRGIERSRRSLPLRAALRMVGISSSRYHSWRREPMPCEQQRAGSCPRRAPNQLTTDEVGTIRELVTSPEYRHVPTGRLAMLAQRMGKVFASASTWYRLVRERGWRRPRQRVHPSKPKVGLRTDRPNAAWHIDTTIVRLLDGSKAYIHAVIDNFSRKILAFRVADTFDVCNTIAVLVEASKWLPKDAQSVEPPMLLVDGGVENFNGGVDQLIDDGVLRRVLAQTDITFSNSLVEAFWRVMKTQWLFLNTLDTVAAVRRCVTQYVAAHNGQIPHSAFRGQTPDEMYVGQGGDVPQRLEAEREAARHTRQETNRNVTCAACVAGGLAA